MISAGDEFGRSQQGNNNAWCQDNRVSWLDWSLLQKNAGFFRFFKECIALRKRHRVFRRDDFFHHDYDADQGQLPEITWQYLTPGEQNWDSDNHGLAFLLRAPDGDRYGGDFFIMLNGDRQKTLEFTAPPPRGKGASWYTIIDSAASSPGDFQRISEARQHPQSTAVTLLPFSCAVLQSLV